MVRYLTKPSPSKFSVHPSILAEVKMTMLLVHHDTFFNLSDHLKKLVSREFKGCDPGKNFASRTKAAAVINGIGNEK